MRLSRATPRPAAPSRSSGALVPPLAVVLLCASSVLVRLVVGLWPYSGARALCWGSGINVLLFCVRRCLIDIVLAAPSYPGRAEEPTGSVSTLRAGRLPRRRQPRRRLPSRCRATFSSQQTANTTHKYHPKGAATPPKYGDYEAQRHWMEVTTNTPAPQWYTDSRHNEPSYWPLDYPPLSGYQVRRAALHRGGLHHSCQWLPPSPPTCHQHHQSTEHNTKHNTTPNTTQHHTTPQHTTQSWIHGKFVGAFEPAAVALDSSRGYETPSSKVLLRWTVVLSDMVTFFPAAVLAARVFRPPGSAPKGRSPDKRELFVLAALLLNPANVLIDHGHFQYNCISLGFALAGAALIAAWGQDVLGSVLFCAALSHKQMSLFYAPAFFAHLLGRCLERKGIARQVRESAAVVRPVGWLLTFRERDETRTSVTTRRLSADPKLICFNARIAPPASHNKNRWPPLRFWA